MAVFHVAISSGSSELELIFRAHGQDKSGTLSKELIPTVVPMFNLLLLLLMVLAPLTLVPIKVPLSIFQFPVVLTTVLVTNAMVSTV